MGGAVMVGIRRSDGREQCSIRWTNELPYLFADPEFQDEGTALERFWERTERWHEQMHPREEYDKPLSAIQRVSYGLVLVDFQSKQLLSRQGYCDFEGVSFVDIDEEDLRIVASLDRKNRIRGLYDRPFIDEAKRISKRHEEEFLSFVRRQTHERERAIRALGEAKLPRDPACANVTFVAYAFPPGWTLDCSDGPPHRKQWRAVKEWIRERGWATPVQDRLG